VETGALSKGLPPRGTPVAHPSTRSRLIALEDLRANQAYATEHQPSGKNAGRTSGGGELHRDARRAGRIRGLIIFAGPHIAAVDELCIAVRAPRSVRRGWGGCKLFPGKLKLKWVKSAAEQIDRDSSSD